jgi:hypothetical protein
MKPKIIFTTLGITVIFFLLGWLVFGVLLKGFYEGNTIQYTGLMKESPAPWAYFISNLCMATLTVYVFTLAGIKSFAKGLVTGLIIFFLVSLSYDIVFFGTMNLFNGAAFFVDVFITTLFGGLLGGLAGLFLGMGKE